MQINLDKVANKLEKFNKEVRESRVVTASAEDIQVKASPNADPSKCLVCGNSCEPITLTGGRKAYYCKAHRAVNPEPV